MGLDIPKQFFELQGKPIISYSIERFREVFPDIEVIVVLPQQYFDLFADESVILVVGGKNRFESVKNGLSKTTGDLIAIHDAVRPFVAETVIREVFEKAELVGAAIPVLELKDSLRQLTSDESIAVDRSKYRVVQTPQVFKANVIKMGYEQPNSSEFTDDASVVEACGQDIALVAGNEENIKITTPFDLQLAHFILVK